MERQTKELETTSGKKVVIKAYLTARETQAINLSVLGNIQTEAGEHAKIALPASAGVTWENEIMKKSVESYDGGTDNPVEKLLDLPNEEYTDIKNKILDVLKVNLKRAK